MTQTPKTTPLILLYYAFSLFAIFTLQTKLVAQPLKISKVIAENKLAIEGVQKLTLVDFWATWCVPCEFANEQLEILQDRIKDKVFMMSISNEASSLIQAHATRMNMKLKVVADYKSETFNKYHINSLPYSILYNRQNEIVWEGHPSNLNEAILEKLYKTEIEKPEKKAKNLYTLLEEKETPFIIIDSNLLKAEATKTVEVQAIKDTSLVLEKTLDTIVFNNSDILETSFYVENDNVYFNGKVSQFLSLLYNVSNQQIYIQPEKDISIQVNLPFHIWSTQSAKIVNVLMQKYKLSSGKSKKLFHSWTAKKINETPKSQSVTQNLQDENFQNYIVEDDKITANNMSISKMVIVLGNLLKTVISYDDNADHTLYNWDLHYSKIDVLKSELLNQYGIVFKKTLFIRNIYVVK